MADQPVCRVCAGPIVQSGRGRPRVVHAECAATHYAESRRRTVAAWRARAGRGAFADAACAVCGAPVPSDRIRYCSPGCAVAGATARARQRRASAAQDDACAIGGAPECDDVQRRSGGAGRAPQAEPATAGDGLARLGIGEDPVPRSRLGPGARRVPNAVDQTDGADDRPGWVGLDEVPVLSHRRAVDLRTRVDDEAPAVVGLPSPVLHRLAPGDDETCPRLADRQSLHPSIVGDPDDGVKGALR